MGDVSSLEAMEFIAINPTPERRLSVDGLPGQKNVTPARAS